MAYSLLKYVHVVLAIIAVGSNATYAVWNVLGARDAKHLGFTLRGIRFIDNRIANPCYGLLLLTGLTLRFIGFSGWPRWMTSAIVLFIVLVVVAAAGYGPALRRQIDALETDGEGSARYAKFAGRARITGIIAAVLALVIVFLMVVKPSA